MSMYHRPTVVVRVMLCCGEWNEWWTSPPPTALKDDLHPSPQLRVSRLRATQSHRLGKLSIPLSIDQPFLRHPDACKQFYLAERSSSSQGKISSKTKVYKDAAEMSKGDTGKRKAAADSIRRSPNPHCLTVLANLWNVTQPSITSMMVTWIDDVLWFCCDVMLLYFVVYLVGGQIEWKKPWSDRQLNVTFLHMFSTHPSFHELCQLL